MDSVTMVINALLKDLKDQIRSRLSWEGFYVIFRNNKRLDGNNKKNQKIH